VYPEGEVAVVEEEDSELSQLAVTGKMAQARRRR
jgi:hypothetical protein